MTDHHPAHDRHGAELDGLFAIEVALAELVAVTETQSIALIARIELLETTTMTKLADIETKLDRLDTMLDAKAASDNADLDAVGTKIDGILAKHAPAVDPEIGSVGTIGTVATE